MQQPNIEIVTGCEACELLAGHRDLPGGQIHETNHWVVEHCVGPLGLGTLIVKPRRHVLGVADLTANEASELGSLLRSSADAARQLVPAEQVYTCLWSHAGGQPVHIHYVVQPVTAEQMRQHSTYGPALQVAMFAAAEYPEHGEIERVANRARQLFTQA